MSQNNPNDYKPVQGKAVAASAATAVNLTAAASVGAGRYSSIEFVAQKDRNSANAGVVWLGFNSTDQLRPFVAGDKWVITAPQGMKIDTADIWLKAATDGDGVNWTGLP